MHTTSSYSVCILATRVVCICIVSILWILDVYYVYELVVLSRSMDNSMHVCILYAYERTSKLVRCIQYDRLRCRAATSG